MIPGPASLQNTDMLEHRTWSTGSSITMRGEPKRIKSKHAAITNSNHPLCQKHSRFDRRSCRSRNVIGLLRRRTSEPPTVVLDGCGGSRILVKVDEVRGCCCITWSLWVSRACNGKDRSVLQERTSIVNMSRKSCAWPASAPRKVMTKGRLHRDLVEQLPS